MPGLVGSISPFRAFHHVPLRFVTLRKHPSGIRPQDLLGFPASPVASKKGLKRKFAGRSHVGRGKDPPAMQTPLWRANEACFRGSQETPARRKGTRTPP